MRWALVGNQVEMFCKWQQNIHDAVEIGSPGGTIQRVKQMILTGKLSPYNSRRRLSQTLTSLARIGV